MYQTIYGPNYSVVVLFMLLVDLLLVGHLTRLRGFGKAQKWILAMLAACSICALSDIACVLLPASAGKLVNFLFNALFQISFASVGLMLFRQLQISVDAKFLKYPGANLITSLPFIILVIGVVASYWTGWIFQVSDDGLYNRGPYYLVCFFFLGIIYYLLTLVSIAFRLITALDSQTRKTLVRNLYYVAPVILGTLAQLIISNVPGSNLGLTFSMVLICLINQDIMAETNAHQSEKYQKILEGLTLDYNAVYFADLKHNFIEVVKHNRNNNGTKYDESLMVHHATYDEINHLYCNGAVVPADQAMYLQQTDRDYMMRTLDESGRLQCRYHVTPNAQGQSNIEVLIVKLRETPKTYEVVMGYRGIDDLIATERAYQEQLEKSLEQARVANKSKTNFLRRMSHDLRTPINGIMGMLDIAEANANDLEKQADCRHKIKEASTYLLSLISDVLDVNKLESSQLTLENEVTNMPELLQELAGVLALNAQDHKVELIDETDFSTFPYPYVYTSPAHLKQIINNVITNAIKYNRENGQVRLHIEDMGLSGNTATLRFVCADTGIGMSPEYIQHAFEPFSQEQRDEVRTKYASTGLGLSIVKELVDLMGGSISIESEVGTGTTFSIDIPFEIAEAPAEEPKKRSSAASVKGAHVLLVEDNDINMEIATFLLENEGITVDKAWNGEEAVRVFKESTPGTYQAIFMDIMMPVMDGLEASKAIRELDRPEAKTIPIVAMTANAFTDDITRSHEAGMNEHITKPLKPEDVIGTLAKYL